ncbi:MAG: hypothetical protein GF320_21005, partial [Armatimonadia bacterium]|nr:hypothetical protein [Armatimonadia bacterium]
MPLMLTLVVGASLVGQPGLTSDGYTLRLAGDQRQLVVEGPGGVEIGRASICELGLADGSRVDMSQGRVRASQDGPTMSLELIRGDLSAVVLITAGDGQFDIDLAVATSGPTVLWAQCPGPLRFDEAAVERMITPTNGNFGVGLELLPGFFSDQAAVDARAWTGELAGGDGYRRLLGGDPVMRPDQDVPVPLTVTPEGAQILTPGAAEALDGASAIVNRPPSDEVPATALIASEHGAWLSLAPMGDGGVLWIGGAVQEDQRP